MSKPSLNPALASLRKRIAKLPTSPGVYRWLNKEGDVLYVGKAKNLRARLKNYVAPDAGKQGAWKEALMRVAADVEATVVRSELEAFVLETNLIKELRPKYNILMKDDKNFVYVRVTVKDAYPRIEVLRRMNDDDALYIGPKTSQYQVEKTLEMLRTLYPYRACKMGIVPADPSAVSLPLDVVCKNKDRPTPCLDHHIGNCSAPCMGLLTPAEYRERCIDPVVSFMKGNQGDVVAQLQEKMKRCAAERKFEVAAKLRDTLSYMEELSKKQAVSDTSREDADVVGVALLSGRAQVVVLRERDGKLIDDVSLELAGSAETMGEVLAQVLPQFFVNTPDFPRLLVLPEAFEGMEALQAWLKERSGHAVEIRIPERGKQSSLLALAMKNAAERAKQRETKWEAEQRTVDLALGELAQVLGLPAPPRRIEGYDISHLGGTETVGSMSVTVDGKPQNRDYRHFTIHGLKSGEVDDYRSIREVLRRRLRYIKHSLKNEEAKLLESGIVIRKARKGDQQTIADIRERRALPTDGHAHKETLLIEQDGDIVGMARLQSCTPVIAELRSVWIDEEHRGGKLGHALIRKLLASVKKGKVYLYCEPSLEEYYAQLGFRHIETPPQALLDSLASRKAATDRLYMMYDALQNKKDPSLESVPDLLMIDGGKGQLGVAVDVLKELGLSIPVIGLAKREEEIFVPGSPVPLALPKESQGRYLLMRLRDEAHRFANRLRETKAKNTLLGKG